MEQSQISKEKVKPKIILKEPKIQVNNKVVKQYIEENFKYPQKYDKEYWDKNLKWTFQNL